MRNAYGYKGYKKNNYKNYRGNIKPEFCRACRLVVGIAVVAIVGSGVFCDALVNRRIVYEYVSGMLLFVVEFKERKLFGEQRRVIVVTRFAIACRVCVERNVSRRIVKSVGVVVCVETVICFYSVFDVVLFKKLFICRNIFRFDFVEKLSPVGKTFYKVVING